MWNYYKNPITDGEKRLEHLLTLFDEFGLSYEDLFYELGTYMGGSQFQVWAEDYIRCNDLEKYMKESAL